MADSTTKIVGFPLYNGVTLLDFAGASEVFAFTNGAYTPIWLAPTLSPILTSEGLSVVPSHTFDKHPPIDILFVPGGDANGVVDSMGNKIFQDFIKTTTKTAAWVGSVCVGAFIVAAARVFDGCSITTYWSQLPNLKLLETKMDISVPQGFPRVVIDFHKKRFSGGGVSSSIDLALKLVEVLNGVEAAQETQLSIQYAPKPSINAGDPSTAPKSLTAKVIKEQAKAFIEPIRKAVEGLTQAYN